MSISSQLSRVPNKRNVYVSKGEHSKLNIVAFLLALNSVIYAQDEIFRRKRLSTSANFVHVFLEIWDKGIHICIYIKFNQF